MSNVKKVNNFFKPIYEEVETLAKSSAFAPFAPFVLGAGYDIGFGFDSEPSDSLGVATGIVLGIMLAPITIGIASVGLALSAACAVAALVVNALALLVAGTADCISPESEPESGHQPM